MLPRVRLSLPRTRDPGWGGEVASVFLTIFNHNCNKSKGLMC